MGIFSKFLVIVICMLYWNSAVAEWKLEPYLKSEFEQIADDLYVLTPPDGRPSIFIKLHIAQQIQSGFLTKEAVYRARSSYDREKLSMDASLSMNSGTKSSHSIHSFGNVDITSENKREDSVGDAVIGAPILSTEKKSEPNTNQDNEIKDFWDPDGKIPGKYDWNESILACKGAIHTGQEELFRDKTLNSFSAFEGHPLCSAKDAEEAARRAVYRYCIEGKDSPGSFQTEVKAIYVSEIKSLPTEELTKPFFVLIGHCSSGEKMRAKLSLSLTTAPVGRCWICGQNSTREDYIQKTEFLWDLETTKLKSLDLSLPRRSSPMMSESFDTEIPLYWK